MWALRALIILCALASASDAATVTMKYVIVVLVPLPGESARQISQILEEPHEEFLAS